MTAPALVKLTNPAALAARWGCSGALVYDMLNSGDLPGFKLGGKLWRIRIADVEAYEAQTAEVTSWVALAEGADGRGGDTAALHDRPADMRTAARLSRLGAGGN